MKHIHWLLGLAGGLALAGQAWAAFIIDDFNVTTSSSILDHTSSDGASTVASTIDGANIVMGSDAGWTRTLSAELHTGHTGDRIKTEVCGACAAGHLISDGISTGISAWIYMGSTVDLSSYTGVSFEYAADVDNALVSLVFSNGDTLTSSSLGNTNNSADITDSSNRTLVPLALGSGDYTSISKVEIVVSGANVIGLDFSIDNVMMTRVPEPTSFALMGLGLAGIGFSRHRSKKVA